MNNMAKLLIGNLKPPLAKVGKEGIVKPDGKTILIDEDGTLHGAAEVDLKEYVKVSDFNNEAIPPEGSVDFNLNIDTFGGKGPEEYVTKDKLSKKYVVNNETDLKNIPIGSKGIIDFSENMSPTQKVMSCIYDSIGTEDFYMLRLRDCNDVTLSWIRIYDKTSGWAEYIQDSNKNTSSTGVQQLEELGEASSYNILLEILTNKIESLEPGQYIDGLIVLSSTIQPDNKDFWLEMNSYEVHICLLRKIGEEDGESSTYKYGYARITTYNRYSGYNLVYTINYHGQQTWTNMEQIWPPSGISQ